MILKNLTILKDMAAQGTINLDLHSTRVDPCQSRALLNELPLKKNSHIIKGSLQLDANMLYYVQINDFEGVDNSEGEGCPMDTKLESASYAGGPPSK